MENFSDVIGDFRYGSESQTHMSGGTADRVLAFNHFKFTEMCNTYVYQ